jgi:hypothetical protein
LVVVVFGLDLLVEAVDFEVVVVRGLLEELLATVGFGLLVVVLDEVVLGLVAVLEAVVFGLVDEEDDVLGCS